MNTDLFFDNFDLLMEAPNGIQKLREMILQLAVQGKLVEQDPEDEPAGVLLERIKGEKERLVKEGKIKKSKALPEIEEGDIPFTLPLNWEWGRLGNLVSLLGDGLHGTPMYSNTGDYYFINGNNLINGQIIIKKNTKTVSYDEYKKYKKILNDNTVLVSINGTLGNVAFYRNENIILGKSACYFNLLGNINKYYMKIIVYSKYFLDYAFENATGSTIKNISLKSMRLYLVPIPPLEEQKRIVAKVDQLMALCDQLESLKQKRKETRVRLNESALDKLLNAGGPEEFAKRWQLICENFDLLYDDLDNLKKLRQAILQLAVQGKLVEQDDSDEPAGVLLERIRGEKERLVKEGKIKKSKGLPEIEEGEIPYSLPPGWNWSRIGNIITNIKGGGTPSKRNLEYWDGDIPWASVKDLGKDKYLTSTIDTITEKGLEKSSTNLIPKGTLIICTRMGLGKIAINNIDVAINQDLKGLSLSQFMLIDYFYSYYLTQEIKGNGVTVSGIRQEDLLNKLIPIPPFEEQKRIVTKVDKLTTFCDQIDLKAKESKQGINWLMGVIENDSIELI